MFKLSKIVARLLGPQSSTRRLPKRITMPQIVRPVHPSIISRKEQLTSQIEQYLKDNYQKFLTQIAAGGSNIDTGIHIDISDLQGERVGNRLDINLFKMNTVKLCIITSNNGRHEPSFDGQMVDVNITNMVGNQPNTQLKKAISDALSFAIPTLREIRE